MDPPPRIIVSLLSTEGDSILLVEHHGPGDAAPSWMLPGGRLEAGESLLAALEREVREETGLRLDGVPSVAFLVEGHAEVAPYSALTFACRTVGTIAPNDPDGFVTRAEWTPTHVAVERLRLVAWYDPGPLERHLREARSAPVHVVGGR